jgi:polysaccharide biosynthesis protein PslH
LTLADDPSDLAFESALARYCRRVVVCRLSHRWSRVRTLPRLLGRGPLTVPYFFSRKLDRQVKYAIGDKGYDRVFVYSSAMAQYVSPAKDIPLITDLVDVDSDKWGQIAGFTRFPVSWVYRREGRYLREYERGVCARSSSVVVCTEREAELARRISTKPVHTIPNGIDTGYFGPSDRQVGDAVPGIIFTGDMSYFPNQQAVVWFARAVFPLIRNRIRAASFVIVGRNPGKRVNDLSKIPGIEVTGFVPDVRPYLAQAQVAVAPVSIATGIQNKILEAMASALPVVCTTRAAQGLTARVAGLEDIADDSAEMAGKIIRLLSDRELAERKGENGRAAVAADYGWERSLARLVELVEASDSRSINGSYSVAGRGA